MKTRIMLFLLFLGCSCIILNAQHNPRDRFEEFKKKRDSAFKKFKDDRNAAFAEYLRNKWEKYQLYKGDKRPQLPKPVDPVLHDTSEPEPAPVKVPVEPAPVVLPTVKPVVPKPLPEPTPVPVRDADRIDFEVCGSACSVRKASLRFRLNAVSEADVANAWQNLSVPENAGLVNDFIKAGNGLGLNDWGYLVMAQALSEVLLPHRESEQVLLQGYLLTQFGVDVRLLRKSDRLVLAIASNETIYDNIYIKISNTKYYLVNASEGGEIYTFSQSFSSNVRPLYMTSERAMNLQLTPSQTKTFVSKRYPEMSVTLRLNHNVLDFYDQYPHCRWEVYAGFPMDPFVEKELRKAFTPVLAGKSEAEVANMLLNFVQTAFDYKTDGEQFGYERTLFAEELFRFPYSDCEDRSVMFAQLVKMFMKRPVVLLSYPKHIATAVCFSEDVSGDYFLVGGKKFVVCDPTYIGASIGLAMPDLRNVSAEIISF